MDDSLLPVTTCESSHHEVDAFDDPSNTVMISQSTIQNSSQDLAMLFVSMSSLDTATSGEQKQSKESKATSTRATENLEDLPQPETYEQAMQSPDHQDWTVALQTELNNHALHGSLLQTQLPPLYNGNVIKSRWILRRKRGIDGKVNRYKVRLTTCDSQHVNAVDLNYDDSCGPMAKPSSYRTFFTLAAQDDAWHMHQMDLETAFLDSKINGEIYLKPQGGIKVEKGGVWRLDHAFYGLEQASHAWKRQLTSEHKAQGWRVSKYDDGVFVNDSLKLYDTIYTDEIGMFGRDRMAMEKAIATLRSKYRVTDEEMIYHHDLEITRRNGKVYVSQQAYIRQILNKYNLNDILGKDTPMEPGVYLVEYGTTKGPTAEEKYAPPSPSAFVKLYQAKIESLNHLAKTTRPDLCFSVSALYRYSQNPTQDHMDAADHVFAYLRTTLHYALVFSRSEDMALTLWVGEDWGGDLDDSHWISGYLLKWGNNPLEWSSEKQSFVTLSEAEAQYVAMTAGLLHAIISKKFLNDLKFEGIKKIDQIKVCCDDVEATSFATGSRDSSSIKDSDTYSHYVEEKVAKKQIKIVRVNGRANVADMFTKALSPGELARCRNEAGIVPVPT